MHQESEITGSSEFGIWSFRVSLEPSKSRHSCLSKRQIRREAETQSHGTLEWVRESAGLPKERDGPTQGRFQCRAFSHRGSLMAPVAVPVVIEPLSSAQACSPISALADPLPV